MMTLQDLAVALLVPACAVFATWKLMPSAARKAFAGRLLELPGLPAPVMIRLRKHATVSGGCGCDGCDRSGKTSDAKNATGPVAQPIRFQRRPVHKNQGNDT